MSDYLLTDEEIKNIKLPCNEGGNCIDGSAYNPQTTKCLICMTHNTAKAQIQKLIDMARREGYIGTSDSGDVVVIGDSQWGFFNKLVQSLKE
jgi:hypothetical protein